MSYTDSDYFCCSLQIFYAQKRFSEGFFFRPHMQHMQLLGDKRVLCYVYDTFEKYTSDLEQNTKQQQQQINEEKKTSI